MYRSEVFGEQQTSPQREEGGGERGGAGVIRRGMQCVTVCASGITKMEKRTFHFKKWSTKQPSAMLDWIGLDMRPKRRKPSFPV